ncbi:hypothetical protein GCM10009827_030270 [Dactylosporangium maewongense]|uniref:EfeO-type cupredoxin-like domain-containing protein n=1 Tax=Dactylosporangium maewongense TaxID=634393 RepID=A0ABN2A9N2_9ACTN
MPAARATVLAAALVLALTGCSADPATPAPAPSTTTATAAAAGTDAPSPTAGTSSAPPSPVATFDKEIVVTVAKKKVTPPTGRVEVAKGNLVRITVTSDVADELHVHGYDKSLALPAGAPASLELRVDRTGLFEVETHASHLVLFQLVVR